MGVIDRLIMNKETQLIIDIISEYDLVGKKVYFEDLSYFTHEKDEYVNKGIEWVLVENTFSMDSVYYGIDGESVSNRVVDIQVISLVYLKLQKYVREFEESNS